MWTPRWKHPDSCLSHSQPTWGEMSPGAECFQSPGLQSRELGWHSWGSGFPQDQSLLLTGKRVWVWWFYLGLEVLGQLWRAGGELWHLSHMDHHVPWQWPKLWEQGTVTIFYPRLSSEQLCSWLMFHSPPAALRTVSHGVTALQNPGTRVERTDSHCGEWLPTLGLLFALDKERLCLSNVP